MKNTHDAIIATLKEEAQGFAEEKIQHSERHIEDALRACCEMGYIAGGTSILRKELVNRLAEKAQEGANKKAHKSGVKKLHKGVKK